MSVRVLLISVGNHGPIYKLYSDAIFYIFYYFQHEGRGLYNANMFIVYLKRVLKSLCIRAKKIFFYMAKQVQKK